MTICILTKDPLTARFLETELTPYLIRTVVSDGSGPLPVCDRYLLDPDTVSPAILSEGEEEKTVLFGWNTDDCDGRFLKLDRPFRPARLRALLGIERNTERDIPVPIGERTVIVGGKTVHLSEKENALLDVLLKARGKPLSRRELHERVWGGEGDEEIVTVYIHYLRQKLESDGVKRIANVRGEGYTLSVLSEK